MTIMNLLQLLELYENNRRQLANALVNAGADSDVALADAKKLLQTLAINTISITCVYKGPKEKE